MAESTAREEQKACRSLCSKPRCSFTSPWCFVNLDLLPQPFCKAALQREATDISCRESNNTPKIISWEEGFRAVNHKLQFLQVQFLKFTFQLLRFCTICTVSTDPRHTSPLTLQQRPPLQPRSEEAPNTAPKQPLPTEAFRFPGFSAILNRTTGSSPAAKGNLLISQ